MGGYEFLRCSTSSLVLVLLLLLSHCLRKSISLQSTATTTTRQQQHQQGFEVERGWKWSIRNGKKRRKKSRETRFRLRKWTRNRRMWMVDGKKVFLRVTREWAGEMESESCLKWRRILYSDISLRLCLRHLCSEMCCVQRVSWGVEYFSVTHSSLHSTHNEKTLFHPRLSTP